MSIARLCLSITKKVLVTLTVLILILLLLTNGLTLGAEKSEHKEAVRHYFLSDLPQMGSLYLKGLILYPFAYAKRAEIENNPDHHLWKYLNSHPGEEYYGDANWRVRKGYPKTLLEVEKLSAFKKFFISYRWNAIRNSHWNYRTKIRGPKLKGRETDREFVVNEASKNNTSRAFFDKGKNGNGKSLFCNFNYGQTGKRVEFFKMKDTPLFRYSYTKPILFKSNYINVMLGYDTNGRGVVCKVRIKNLKKVEEKWKANP